MGVDEWRAHIAPISIVKQLVYCLPMLVNWLNTNFGIAPKLGEHGNGWHSSCMNFVGLGPTTMMILIGNKPSLGKGFLRSLPKKSRFGAFSKELLFWTKWIECNDRVFNHEQWHESKVKHIIWDDLDMYAKVARERFIKFVKICVYSTAALLKDLDQTSRARNVLCRRTNLHIIWKWKRQRSHVRWAFVGLLVTWRLSLVGRFGQLSLMGFGCLVTSTWQCGTSEALYLPSQRAHLPLVLNAFGIDFLAFWPSISQIIIK